MKNLRFYPSKVAGEPRSTIFRYNHLLLRKTELSTSQVRSSRDLVSLFAQDSETDTSARVQAVLFVFYAVHVQLKDSERQISLWMSVRRHRAPVPPLIRHGGRVIDSPGLRFFTSFPPLCRLLSRRFFYDTVIRFPASCREVSLSCNSEGARVLHEKVSGTRLESRTKCHGNVNEVPPTFDTFTECPLPQRTLPLVR